MKSFQSKIQEIRINVKSTEMTIYLHCGDQIIVKGRKTVKVINEVLNGK